MNRIPRAAACRVALFLAWTWLGCAGMAPESPAPTQAKGYTPAGEGVLYSFGYALADSVTLHDLDEAELAEVVEGLSDHARGREPRYGSVSENRAGIGGFLVTRKQEMGERELAASQPFLEAAARAEGAVTTENGAILTVLEVGEGASPQPEQRLHIQYRGTLRDGSLVRETRPGEPYVFRFETANACWKEALRDAAPGARLRVVCPPDLAFGMQGHIGWAPPGAVVTWEIELLDVTDE